MPDDAAPAPVHRYRTTCRWEGSTGAGYEGYDRRHVVSVPPVEPELALSADPAFRGDPALVNPEQLVVAAASSCQLLSFLAVAARARVDVVAYTDEAEAQMPTDDLPVRLTRITLRPRITIRHRNGRPTEQRVRRLVEVAHRECFIANSLRTEVVVEPTVTFG